MSYGSPKWREWVLEEKDSRPFIKRALEIGINFFDTADMYSNGSSEEILGRAIKDFTKRDEVVIATKVYFPLKNKPNSMGLSRKHILESIDASLKRLQTDYIDLYQIHRWDYDTPIEETMEALHDVVKSGKARYIGASSMWAWQFAKAQYFAKYNRLTPFISMQHHYNLIYREEEREMVPLCKDLGVGLLPWSPLARGLLSGKRTRGEKGDTLRSKTDPFLHTYYGGDAENDNDIIHRVTELAAKKSVSPSQLSIAWLLNKQQVVAPIIGTTKMHQLEELCSSLSIQFTSEELKYLEELYRPHKISGHQ